MIFRYMKRAFHAIGISFEYNSIDRIRRRVTSYIKGNAYLIEMTNSLEGVLEIDSDPDSRREQAPRRGMG